ncbi:hypothetical protein HIM_00498 [Hirsutella minnesotensis 3608]|nr:hypothetical protein HIM_00498 [Hirsutella minnesotensis 3608]
MFENKYHGQRHVPPYPLSPDAYQMTQGFNGVPPLHNQYQGQRPEVKSKQSHQYYRPPPNQAVHSKPPPAYAPNHGHNLHQNSVSSHQSAGYANNYHHMQPLSQDYKKDGYAQQHPGHAPNIPSHDRYPQYPGKGHGYYPQYPGKSHNSYSQYPGQSQNNYSQYPGKDSQHHGRPPHDNGNPQQGQHYQTTYYGKEAGGHHQGPPDAYHPSSFHDAQKVDAAAEPNAQNGGNQTLRKVGLAAAVGVGAAIVGHAIKKHKKKRKEQKEREAYSGSDSDDYSDDYYESGDESEYSDEYSDDCRRRRSDRHYRRRHGSRHRSRSCSDSEDSSDSD